MFNIGMSEMILVFIVALIVFGPDRLPEIARTVGKSVNELKKMGNDIVDAATETKDTAKNVSQIEMKEVEESLQKFKEAHNMLAEGSDAVRNEVEETTELADEVARKSMTADITAPVRKEAVTKAADIARKEEKPVKEHDLET